MGEPLFHPQICSMVAALSKDRKVFLLTNGTLLSAQMAENLIRAGISQLWISMDGFEKAAYEAIQIGSRFDRICRNIEAFNAARKATDVRLGITFVITPDNLEQLEKLNDFADWAAADEINLSHMIPNSPMPQEALLLDRADIPVGKMRRLGDFVQPHPEHKCPFIEQQATFVRWDGNVTPCMQMLHSCCTYLYEEKRKIQSFQYGNVAEKSLPDCWNDQAYAEFRFRFSTFYFPFCTVCFGCEDRKENQTDCFSGDGPTCGACLWSSGKVFCP